MAAGGAGSPSPNPSRTSPRRRPNLHALQRSVARVEEQQHALQADVRRILAMLASSPSVSASSAPGSSGATANS